VGQSFTQYYCLQGPRVIDLDINIVFTQIKVSKFLSNSMDKEMLAQRQELLLSIAPNYVENPELEQ
jgi:hypothetical protein